MQDECICKGNWQTLVKKYDNLIGRMYKDKDGHEWRFFGLVHGKIDYYYGMTNLGGISLLSCVGDIEDFGFELVYE